MTGPLLEPEKSTQPPRLGVVSGAVLGTASIFLLSWLTLVGTRAFNNATSSPDNVSLAFAGLLLLVGGLVLGLVGFAGRFHPLIPGLPAIWFGIVFGPSLAGLGGPPSWFPEFITSFFLRTGSSAVFMIFGYLILATAVSLLRRRRNWIFR
ncbi:MAG: hypothetical protein ACLFRT_02700 [Actinomycetota bacterium]